MAQNGAKWSEMVRYDLFCLSSSFAPPSLKHCSTFVLGAMVERTQSEG
ncbi:MAG: hypothetical protein IKH95_04890 [Bacteroidaceae bacterium]|nr:hypothetical protein [Bacteroidaceae bacterium]